MDQPVALKSLKDRPFELLVEIERRSRAAVAGSRVGAQGREWVGVAFRMATETFLVARDETREVLGYPTAITRVPGARAWIKGLANVRGQLLPVLDLQAIPWQRRDAAGPQYARHRREPSRDTRRAHG